MKAFYSEFETDYKENSYFNVLAAGEKKTGNAVSQPETVVVVEMASARPETGLLRTAHILMDTTVQSVIPTNHL